MQDKNKTIEQMIQGFEGLFTAGLAEKILDTAPYPILIQNPDTSIVYVNPALEKLTGYNSIDLVNQKAPYSYWPAEKAKQYLQLMKDGFGKPTIIRATEISLKKKNGEPFIVEVSAASVMNNQKEIEHVVSVWVDITERKKVERKLIKLNENLEAAQLISKMGSWEWDMATNSVTWSEELCHMLGWNTNDPIPQFPDLERFYTPGSWKRLNDVVARCLATGQSYDIETDQIPINGPMIHSITRGTAKYNVEGKIAGLHGMVQDVTEQRRAERETVTILRTTMDGFYLVDTQGRILDTNDAYCSMIGYSRGELLRMRVADIEAADTDEVIKRRIQQISTVGYARFVTKHKRKDGRIIDIEASVNYLAETEPKLVCFMRDITEHMKTEETLKLQASLLDAELDSVYLLDLAGHILYVNKAVCVSHGYSKEELLNMNLSQLDDSESADLISPRIKGILEKGYGTFNINHRRKDGSLIPMEIHTTLVETDDKQLLLSVARDITERRNLQEQLMAQDRLVSIGQLVSGVAHEINNPLTSVIGFSELLLKRDLPADAKDDLKIVNDEAKRTALIVKNLLTFARKQPEGKVPVEVNEQIERVVALRIHEEKTNNIQVNLNLAPDLPRILGNSSQLQQVFFNIITNAEQSMLEAHNKGVLTIATEQAGDMVKVSFSDDGPGISPENMKKLFTPFFTTKEVGKGTGLGLSISHGIVTEHGGKIYVESKVGEGATFMVELPIPK